MNVPALKADETASSSSLISLASLELPRLGLRVICEDDGSRSCGVFEGSIRIWDARLLALRLDPPRPGESDLDDVSRDWEHGSVVSLSVGTKQKYLQGVVWQCQAVY